MLLGSTKYTIQRIRENPCLIKKVRMVFKHVLKAGGVYRKRIASTGRAYMKHNEFCECVKRADMEKLTRMIKILSFLIQTKVYLFGNVDRARFRSRFKSLVFTLSRAIA